MVWILVAVILLIVACSGQMDSGAWLRIGAYAALSVVFPVLVIPIGVCWVLGSMAWWAVSEVNRSRQAKRDRAAAAINWQRQERQREVDAKTTAEWQRLQALEAQKRSEAELAEWERLNPPGQPRWTDPHKSHGFG